MTKSSRGSVSGLLHMGRLYFSLKTCDDIDTESVFCFSKILVMFSCYLFLKQMIFLTISTLLKKLKSFYLYWLVSLCAATKADNILCLQT